MPKGGYECPRDECDSRKGKRKHGDRQEKGWEVEEKGEGFQCGHSNRQMIQVPTQGDGRKQKWKKMGHDDGMGNPK